MPGPDGVVEEHRVDRLAHRVVAAERERHVAHAAGDLGVRQGLLDLAGGFDEVDAVVVVFLDAGGDGEDVGVEDDVFRREAHLFGEYLVGAGADLDLAFFGVSLAGFIEGHDDNRRAVLAAQFGVFDELVFAFFHADGVDDAFALHALQAGFDDRPIWRSRS